MSVSRSGLVRVQHSALILRRSRASHRMGESARYSAGQCVVQNRQPSQELNWRNRPIQKATSALACMNTHESWLQTAPHTPAQAVGDWRRNTATPNTPAHLAGGRNQALFAHGPQPVDCSAVIESQSGLSRRRSGAAKSAMRRNLRSQIVPAHRY